MNNTQAATQSDHLSPPARLSSPKVGLAWANLTPAQQEALKPLEHDWDQLSVSSHERWVELANRFPQMSFQERRLVQARMINWARLQPADRGEARLRFQNTRQLSAEERRAKWAAYKNLTAEQQAKLNSQAQLNAAGQKAALGSGQKAAALSNKKNSSGNAKSNIVPNPNVDKRLAKSISPSEVRDGPGATTSLVSRRPSPPMHLQPGLPKIAATAPFVDPKTLLPRRGAQAAAAQLPSSSAAVGPQ